MRKIKSKKSAENVFHRNLLLIVIKIILEKKEILKSILWQINLFQKYNNNKINFMIFIIKMNQNQENFHENLNE